MSIKRIYPINCIYYLNTRGFYVFICANFTNKKFTLLSGEKTLAVQLKGIESLSGKKVHSHCLLLASSSEDESELMNFLNMNNQWFLENVKNVYLEIEFFDEQEIKKILEYEN